MFMFTAKNLLRALDVAAMPARSADEMTPILCCVPIRFTDQGLIAVSTDRYQLVRTLAPYVTDAPATGAPEVHVHRDGIKMLLPVLKAAKNGYVTVEADAAHLTVTCEAQTITLENLAGEDGREYPRIDSLFRLPFELLPHGSERLGAIVELTYAPSLSVLLHGIAPPSATQRVPFAGYVGPGDPVPLPGAAALYRALVCRSGEAGLPVFYLSTSPWNLHDLLARFIAKTQPFVLHLPESAVGQVLLVAQRLRQRRFTLHIKMVGGFIQQQQTRAMDQRAGQRNALTLPARQLHAPLAHHGVQAVRQGLHEVQRMCRPQRSFNLRRVGVRAGVGHVDPHRVVKEEGVLRHGHGGAAQAA